MILKQLKDSFCISLFVAFFIIVHSSLAQDDNDFESALNSLDSAIEKFLNGNPDDFINFWSHSDDVTIAGGFGGVIEKGWYSISKRLERVNSVYSKATFETERISIGNDDKFGYLVQHELIKFYGKDENVEMTRNYRITMIFRNEINEWKLIHRHADANMNWDAPE
ncbi:MAG: nuclear transport factor 2 family protein [Melioribacteraceae bacterium]|nr:MAG: nuclear transport factor 2 family protein [Melioribacteraceae bacterium]